MWWVRENSGLDLTETFVHCEMTEWHAIMMEYLVTIVPLIQVVQNTFLQILIERNKKNQHKQSEPDSPAMQNH